MKKLPIVIIVALVLIIGYLLLTKPAVAPVVELETTGEVESPEANSVAEERGTSAVATEENIVIQKDSLSDGQQKVLDTFGVDSEEIVITPEMIACAEEKIGKERVIEIVDGAAPSFMEGLSLASCY